MSTRELSFHELLLPGKLSGKLLNHLIKTSYLKSDARFDSDETHVKWLYIHTCTDKNMYYLGFYT